MGSMPGLREPEQLLDVLLDRLGQRHAASIRASRVRSPAAWPSLRGSLPPTARRPARGSPGRRRTRPGRGPRSTRWPRSRELVLERPSEPARAPASSSALHGRAGSAAASSAACGSRPSSSRGSTTCRWPCGWKCPPITPNGPSSEPSRTSRPGDDRVERALTGRDAVRVAGLEREARPAVLQRDARPGRRRRRCRSLVEALDQRARAALAVDAAEVDRAAARKRAGDRRAARSRSISARRSAR